MSGLCLSAGALSAIVQAASFTLSWTHSVEHITWEEDWRVEDSALVLVEARIRGSGAGMDPPEGAVLRAGVWHYRVARRVDRLRLSSGSGQPEYRLCVDGRCRSLVEFLGGPAPDGVAEVGPCEAPAR